MMIRGERGVIVPVIAVMALVFFMYVLYFGINVPVSKRASSELRQYIRTVCREAGKQGLYPVQSLVKLNPKGGSRITSLGKLDKRYAALVPGGLEIFVPQMGYSGNTSFPTGELLGGGLSGCHDLADSPSSCGPNCLFYPDACSLKPREGKDFGLGMMQPHASINSVIYCRATARILGASLIGEEMSEGRRTITAKAAYGWFLRGLSREVAGGRYPGLTIAIAPQLRTTMADTRGWGVSAPASAELFKGGQVKTYKDGATDTGLALAIPSASESDLSSNSVQMAYASCRGRPVEVRNRLLNSVVEIVSRVGRTRRSTEIVYVNPQPFAVATEAPGGGGMGVGSGGTDLEVGDPDFGTGTPVVDDTPIGADTPVATATVPPTSTPAGGATATPAPTPTHTPLVEGTIPPDTQAPITTVEMGGDLLGARGYQPPLFKVDMEALLGSTASPFCSALAGGSGCATAPETTRYHAAVTGTGANCVHLFDGDTYGTTVANALSRRRWSRPGSYDNSAFEGPGGLFPNSFSPSLWEANMSYASYYSGRTLGLECPWGGSGCSEIATRPLTAAEVASVSGANQMCPYPMIRNGLIDCSMNPDYALYPDLRGLMAYWKGQSASFKAPGIRPPGKDLSYQPSLRYSHLFLVLHTFDQGAARVQQVASLAGWNETDSTGRGDPRQMPMTVVYIPYQDIDATPAAIEALKEALILTDTPSNFDTNSRHLFVLSPNNTQSRWNQECSSAAKEVTDEAERYRTYWTCLLTPGSDSTAPIDKIAKDTLVFGGDGIFSFQELL